MFVADSGLFVTLAFWDKAYTDNVIYDKLLSDKLAAISVTMPSGSFGSSSSLVSSFSAWLCS